jgi:hypothetical protein
MTDLLSELRRSAVAGDREVAELLHSLRPADGDGPRASEQLAAFIAERSSGMAAEPRPRGTDPDLLVVLGGAPVPRPARRRRVLAGVWAKAAVAAAAALVAVAVVSGGPPHDVVVRPTDVSTTAPPASAPPTGQTDPTPQRQQPVAPSAGSRPHRARIIHPAATSTTATNPAPPVRSHAAATSDRGDEPAAADEGGETTDEGSSSDGGETPDGGGDSAGETQDAADD